MQPLTTCDELKDWLGAYVIGATTPSENLAIKRLLDICPEARALLDDYLLVRDALTHLDTASHNAPRPNSLIASLPMPIAPPTKLTHANEHRQQPQPVPETLEKLRPAPAPARTRAFPIAAWYAFGGVAAALILVFGVLVVVDQFLNAGRTRTTHGTSDAIQYGGGSHPPDEPISRYASYDALPHPGRQQRSGTSRMGCRNEGWDVSCK